MNRQKIKIDTADIAYSIMGEGDIEVVIEMGLGATMGEWWHIAERISQTHTVLLYERAGIGESSPSTLERSPKNIVLELADLISHLPHQEKLTLLCHSQGGLYGCAFAVLFPQFVKKLILLDPLSNKDNDFKTCLTPKEFKKSGVDKSANFSIMQKLARLHMGWLIKKVMQQAPPFYYYKDFNPDCRNDILEHLVSSSLYSVVIEEYRLSHVETELEFIVESDAISEIPITLITHSSEKEIEELRVFGHIDKETSAKIEGVWQDIMKNYLAFSKNSKLLSAANSCHFIHLTDTDLVISQI